MSSSLPAIARRVAERYASKRAYKVDRSEVRKDLSRYNDPAAIQDSQQNLGGYTVATFELVPISKIVLEKKWHPGRGPRIQEALDKGKALPPVHLTAEGGRYGISDGIHRTNVSLENGFTLVPAIVTRWIETPELKEAPPVEKRKLAEGDWVELSKPVDGRRIGWVEEVFPSTKVKGVRRWRYNLALVAPGDDWPDFIDESDDAFEPLRTPPSWGRKIKDSL